VRGFQRDPEALEARGLLLAVVILLAAPPLRRGPGQLQMEDMTVLDLEPVRADVVLGLAELGHDLEFRQPGFLAGLAQGRCLGRLSRADAPGGDLDADFLMAVVSVPEHQQLSITDDIAQHLVPGDPLGHGLPHFFPPGDPDAATTAPASMRQQQAPPFGRH